MASNKTISIGFKIEQDGKDGFKLLIQDAKSFTQAMQKNVMVSEGLHKSLVNFSTLSSTLDGLKNAFGDLQGFVKDFSSAYDTQMEAERQLEQVMRNTMGARQEDIQSIKDFCSAQQQIGIVGDEVQLAGAQELATYLELKGSLKSLIPVMNDMIAQQYGYNHSAENASQIATMLGKVMNGQTGALSRYGYTFDEAQEKILKYGTEAERVAVLVDVVSQSVGGMNEKLAQTDTGRMKQLENNLGDLKEKLGAFVKSAEPVLAIGSNAIIATAGVLKLVQGLKALKLSLTGVQAASGIVGVALAALIGTVMYFMSRTNDAASSLDKLTDAKERARREAEMHEEVAEAEADALKSAKSALEMNIAKLKEFNGTKTEEKKVVKEMNETYGETMGYFKTVAEWYNTLIKNSKAYCDQMVKEAKTRKLADQLADLELERDRITTDEYGNKKKYSTHHDTRNRTRNVNGHEVNETYELPSDLDKAQGAYNKLTKRQNAIRKQMEANASAKIQMPVMGSHDKPEDRQPSGGSSHKNVEKTLTRLQQVNAEIAKIKEAWPEATEAERDAMRQSYVALGKEKDAIELTLAELDRPDSLNTVRDIDAELEYQNKLIATATPENIGAIMAERDALIEKRDALMGVTKATEEVVFIPARPEDAKTIEDTENAISDLDKKIQTASADEVEEYQRTKMAFEEKKKALERGIEIPRMQMEVADLMKLSDRELKIKVRGMGFEELSDRIRDLDRQLTDLDNPPTEGQRKAMEELRATYASWRKECVMTFDTFKSGWSAVSGVERGIDKLSGALDDNATVWQRLTSVVDGFIQIYDGISAIIGVINTLNMVTNASAAAQTANAAATAASTTAKGAESVAAEANAAAQIPAIAANKAATQSFVELAAAEYMAAHAYIPFAGFGIAEGFTAAAVASVQAINAIPFAEGGVVAGPTLALVGEYAGARNNPEVIAPLDRLRDIIEPRGNDFGHVEFEIRQDRLVGILKKAQRKSSRI